MTFVPSTLPGFGGGAQDFSVNSASADALLNAVAVLRTGSRTNAAGSYAGDGTGNKAIQGISGFDQVALGDLKNISFQWENVLGPAGPNYIPPEAITTSTPYVNFLVDFAPKGAGDLRVLVVITDQLAGVISASVGSYANNGSNLLTYSWDSSQNALVVQSPPDPVPGGVLPDVTVGPLWPENSYKFSDLVAANPDAVLVDAYPGDDGLPAGAIMPAVLLMSGDSGTVTKSGKRLSNLKINDTAIFAP